MMAPLLLASTVPASLDNMEAPPSGWTGKEFSGSYQFPTTAPVQGAHPWEQINFKTDPNGYMEAVLAYVLEGQDVTTWRVQDNLIRKWYHMPWMGPGASGREFINGLTRERSSRAGELGPGQSSCRQNWAVGFYNPAGGYALGRIWKPVANGTGGPNFAALPFPRGTVVAKLLYTEASEMEVPLLQGAPTVLANIHVDPNPLDDDCPSPTAGSPQTPSPRAPKTLRLLQLDIAIRDPNANATTGWVFGTFVYDGRIAGTDPWKKLKPVGLMWGNDHDLSDAMAAQGIKPSESVVLSDFGLGRAFGRGGRMNGPVDNPVSACLSCHMTAQWPNPANLTPRGGSDWMTVSCWFRNLAPGTPFGTEPKDGTCGAAPAAGPGRSLDYSLQMVVAARNWQAAHPAMAPVFFAAPVGGAPGVVPATPQVDNAVLEIDGVESLPVRR